MTQILSVPIVAQADPRWKDARLGLSQSSIGGYGCAIACIAMLGAYVQQQPPIPLHELNGRLKDIGGYHSSNLLRWIAAGQIYPRLQYVSRIDIGARPARVHELNEIVMRVSLGLPVIIYVDSSNIQPGLQQHFVIVTGVDQERQQFTIQDPWFGDSTYLCPRYGKTVAEAVWGIILFDTIHDPDATPVLRPTGAKVVSRQMPHRWEAG